MTSQRMSITIIIMHIEKIRVAIFLTRLIKTIAIGGGGVSSDHVDRENRRHEAK